jgi:aminoglycoside phosphotransferase (APT) family kinase protein
MAGISALARDHDQVARELVRWWTSVFPMDGDARIRDITTNRTSGFSSESLLVDVEVRRDGDLMVDEVVLRLPPAGGGLFPEYDLGRQAAVQALLADAGIPAPRPVRYEDDTSWLGSPFMVMPRIAGDLPSDFTYPVRGWVHDAPADAQRRVAEQFVDHLAALHSVDTTSRDLGFLERPAGTGLAGEIGWWSDYLDWATDGSPTPLMADAYAWVRSTSPTHTDPPSLLWGDARFANVIYSPDRSLVGMLDWEQAAVGPAEFDLGFWLATRRQSAEAVGVAADPEVPGFPTRAEVVARYQAALGRTVRDLPWHETFAMIRMGTCIAATQRLLVRAGKTDHFMLAAPLLPEWTIAAIESDPDPTTD